MIVIDTRSIENYVCDGSSIIDNQNFTQKDEWIRRQEKHNETTGEYDKKNITRQL